MALKIAKHMRRYAAAAGVVVVSTGLAETVYRLTETTLIDSSLVGRCWAQARTFGSARREDSRSSLTTLVSSR